MYRVQTNRVKKKRESGELLILSGMSKSTTGAEARSIGAPHSLAEHGEHGVHRVVRIRFRALQLHVQVEKLADALHAQFVLFCFGRKEKRRI